ncbi:MAG: glycosyltransferase family 4 protein [Gammaproteobacteria bacterium]|nr:glycosyltransferase family 4 protein [Gammaproteobacteria bacterium]
MRATDKKQTIIMFANTDWYLYNFRRSLIREYQRHGFEVVLLSPGEYYAAKLLDEGFNWIKIPLITKSMNPYREFRVLMQLFSIFRRHKPVLLHNFTIKPALYGSLIARLMGGVQIVNGITGLGHVFTAPGVKAWVIRGFVKLLYRMILSSPAVQVIFQNEDDREVFVGEKLVTSRQANIVRGSGVNCELFKPRKERRGQKRVKVLFASRLLKEKGICELLEAKELLKNSSVNCEILIAGDIYTENPSSLSRSEAEQLDDGLWVRYLGHVEDMPSLILQSDIVVLPSYREGTPKILLEAAACGKPIIASDIAGCRGIVQDGINGILVPVKDVRRLAQALELLISQPELRSDFGKNSRQIALQYFDERIINHQTLDVVRALSLSCPMS